MNQMLVLSLYTDRGPRQDEFNRMKEEMTGTVTNPIYVVVDPFTGKKLGQYDYNVAKKEDFAIGLEKNLRRFNRMRKR